MEDIRAYTSRDIQSVKSFSELLKEYIAVSSRLHGESFAVTEEEFRILLEDPKEIVSFVLLDGKLVATAQASLLWSPPELQGYINNVVTDPDFGGRGLGRIAMETMEQAVRDNWGDSGNRKIKLLLSNSPKKENGGFYEKLGWRSRGPESEDPTLFWVKTI